METGFGDTYIFLIATHRKKILLLWVMGALFPHIYLFFFDMYIQILKSFMQR